MSKKRTLIFVLGLLPLAISGAVVATLANGSRSVEFAPLSAAAIPQAGLSDAADEGAPRFRGLPFDTLSPSVSTPASGGAQPSRSGDAPMLVHAEEASVEPMFASQGAIESGGQIATLADAGAQLHRRLYTPGGARRSIGGGGGGGSAGRVAPSTAIGSEESTTPPTYSDEGHESLRPSEDPTHGSNDENSGSGPGDDLIHPPTKLDDTESNEEEELIRQDPLDRDLIYIPPRAPPVVQVPEPATLGLLGLGLLGCAAARRKRAS